MKDGPEFTSIEVPGATDTVARASIHWGRSWGGIRAGGSVHGFFRSRDGSFLTIDAPGATATEASGITPQGVITGVYRTADGRFHGFILSADGFETIDASGALHTGSAAGGMSMTASGELAGYYRPADAQWRT